MDKKTGPPQPVPPEIIMKELSAVDSLENLLKVGGVADDSVIDECLNLFCHLNGKPNSCSSEAEQALGILRKQLADSMKVYPGDKSPISYRGFEYEMVFELFRSRTDDHDAPAYTILEAVNNLINKNEQLGKGDGQSLTKALTRGLNKMRFRLTIPETESNQQKEEDEKNKQMAAQRRMAREALKNSTKPGALLGAGGQIETKSTATHEDYQKAIRQMSPSVTPDRIARALGVSLQAVRVTLRKKDV